MNNEISKALGIRYIKLHFTVEFIENTILPVYKASALRGGMGEMLLRSNCIRNRDCDRCDFESECIVRRTMYSKMDIRPSFMTSGDSVGYVIECEDYRESCNAGDTLNFNLILFGKTIVYFSQFLNAFYMLGRAGLGKDKSIFRITGISNSKNEPILDGYDINMAALEILTLRDYVEYRKNQIDKSGIKNHIRFKSPLSVKFRGEELKEFRIDAIFEAACRRIYMLDCFEGIESIIHEKEYMNEVPLPKVLAEAHTSSKIRRFSNHQNSAMYLKGIEGELQMDDINERFLDIILAGELIHIGKNTSFGFGRYRVS